MNNPIAYIRTYAPIIAGAVLTWLIASVPAVADAVTAIDRYLGIDRTAITVAGAGIIMAIYYALARWLGKRWPTVEKWMLGSSAKPVYVPAVPAAPDVPAEQS